jgi:anthranilate synthase/aminodeoxychorismate synthase-like glutamine amidotransferase
MILVIDNYDSFTYNLVQMVGTINPDIKVIRNNQFELNQIEIWNPSHILISPGPGRPESAGHSISVIKKYGEHIPILGVCLGHQSISIAYGGSVSYSKEIIHGKTSKIKHNGSILYKGIEGLFNATRYHSLIVEKKSLPKELIVNSQLSNGLIMGIEHKSHPVYGIQFHPESIATKKGEIIINNFLKINK